VGAHQAIVLGAPRPVHLNAWKDSLTDDARRIGWDVTHIPARGPSAADVVRACRGADVLLWARTHGHQPTGDVAGMLRRVEDRGTRTVALHLDLYWGIARRTAEIGVHPWWSCQSVWTADGAHQKAFAVRRVNHHWLPPAIGRRWLATGVADRRKWPARIVFVGGLVRGIHGSHRAELLGWAAQYYRSAFRRYGHKGAQVWGVDLSHLYASANVLLGDSAPSPRYWSDRVPHSLGRANGPVLAHPRTDGMTERGITSETAVLYDRWDFTGLARRVAELSPVQRREMSAAATTLVAERHLWEHRLREIEETALCG
jgi:hypothetical protein